MMEYSDETLLDVFMPSFPASPRSISYENLRERHQSSSSKQTELQEATDFLHREQEFLIAAELGDEAQIQSLIKKGTDIQVKDYLGRNAVHLAVCSGHLNVVARLLAAGVESNVKDDLGMTPLSLCLIRSPSSVLIRLLLNNGAVLLPRCRSTDTNLFLQFVMLCIPTKEEENILRLLIANGALISDPDAPGGRQALHFAAMSNNTCLIDILIDLGAPLFDVNHRNETPKQVATSFNCKEAYALLERYEQAVRDGDV